MSVVAEQYRVAAARLVLSSGNQENSVIVVTSAMAGEGKSSTACNLAYVLAQDLGKQTLLIDCDFKRPMVHAYTGVPAKPGLAEAIYGDAPVEACTHQCGETSMWVLPAGRRDHRLVDLTKIPQLNSIVTELKARFEFIILDAPPILPMADMNLLASMADTLVLVVRAGVTHHELVQKSIKALKPLNRAMVILNGLAQENDPEYSQNYHHAGRRTYSK
jgi:capsular exopolysaccharide synthesis family protein